MPEVFLSFGSNLGDREKNILDAIRLIDEISDIKIIRGSSLYEAEPVGFKKQNYFFNIVLRIHTNLSPFELLREIENIERKLGKDIKRKWGPRKIDIDILYYDRDIIKTEKLTIPHPLINERMFVLVPMMEIASDFICPKTKMKISDIKGNCNKKDSVANVKKWEELVLFK